MQISIKQKITIVTIGIVILIFYLFITFVYNPEKKQLNDIKQEYIAAKAQVEEFNRMVGEGKQIGDVISAFNNKMDVFDSRFPEKEEVMLREISGACEKAGITVSSIVPQKKRDLQLVSIKHSIVQEMPISISLTASYKKLGELLRILRDDLPVFVRVDNVSMSKSGGPQSSLLNVSLNMNTYLISRSQSK